MLTACVPPLREGRKKYNVTVPEKTDHSVQISDVEILVPCCSALFTLSNSEVRTMIEYTFLELRASRIRAPKISEKGANL